MFVLLRLLAKVNLRLERVCAILVGEGSCWRRRREGTKFLVLRILFVCRRTTTVWRWSDWCVPLLFPPCFSE